MAASQEIFKQGTPQIQLKIKRRMALTVLKSSNQFFFLRKGIESLQQTLIF